MADEVKTPINDEDVASVQGGYGGWEAYAKGTYVHNGTCILYKIAPGDALSGIAIRFGVTPEKIMLWNPDKIKNINTIYAGQQIVIYPTIIR
ncbi:MAG: LysM peptidoglycan-binding domain-containing protein [Oscillospiraceae bacterium]|nr:LysM peptidoglycan-binding domain-containing protein [Oscillospiraceae bacterium]